MSRIIINESQFNMLLESQLINESIFEVESLEEFKAEIKKYIKRMLMVGMSVSAIYSVINKYCDNHQVSDNVKQAALGMVNSIPQSTPIKTLETQDEVETKGDWKLVDNKTTATVYNAVPEQCNADFGHTASMFRLNLNDVLSQRVIAMERTFMSRLGLKYGDVVYLEGVGEYDGVWQIQDTMNKKYAGQRKIDILVPNHIKGGLWQNVKIYTLKDKSMTDIYKAKMAPQLSKAENQRQVQQMKQKLLMKNKRG